MSHRMCSQNNSPTKTSRAIRSAIDERTTRHEGYGMSQSRRAMIECIFGWDEPARYDA